MRSHHKCGKFCFMKFVVLQLFFFIMRFIVLLINIHLCYGVVIKINPIKIIAYRRNETDDRDKPFDEKTDPKKAQQKFEIKPLFGKNTSYSGHLIANEKAGTRLFFWFFKSNRSPKTDPLIVWIQGQPNASSLYGLFDEHGPYEINATDLTMKSREKSWCTENNVLYLDAYPGCGYSYTAHSDGFSDRLEDVAQNIINSLDQFFYVYPNFTKNPVYLAGESLAGKYLFIVAHGIHERNKNKLHKHKINLQGLVIGNPFMDSMQLGDYRRTYLQMGLLDVKDYNELEHDENMIKTLIQSKQYSDALALWKKKIYSKVLEAGYKSLYDLREVNAFWNSLVPTFLKRSSILDWLKVTNKTFQAASMHEYVTANAMKPIDYAVVETLRYYKVLLYTGQFDMFVPYRHTANYLNFLGWSHLVKFNSNLSPKTMWKEGDRTMGYWKTAENLTHLVIRNAGHMVGVGNSDVLFYMIKNFMSDGFKAKNFFRARLMQTVNKKPSEISFK